MPISLTTTRRLMLLASRRAGGLHATTCCSGGVPIALTHHARVAPSGAATGSTSGAASREGTSHAACGCGLGARALATTPRAMHVAASFPAADPLLATSTTPSSDHSPADLHFMGLALDQARVAAANGEVPVGAVLVRTGPPTPMPGAATPPPPSSPFTPTILAADRNRVEATHDATAHAELLVLRAASAAAPPGGWRLGGTTLYVTLEPCAMCAGAALLARVDRLVYGAPNPAVGADGGWVGLLAAAKGDVEGAVGLERVSAGGEEGGVVAAPPPLSAHGSHPGLEVTRGVRAEEAAALMRGFFRARRAGGGAPGNEG